MISRVERFAQKSREYHQRQSGDSSVKPTRVTLAKLLGAQRAGGEDVIDGTTADRERG